MATIHPSAFVSDKAQLADDVVIGPCVLIEDDVVIGSGTKVDAFASIKRFTTLGENNHIHTYACIGGEPQDLKFANEDTTLVIGNNNNIREFSTIHRGTAHGGGVTKVGDNNLLMSYTHIAHDCQVGSNIVMSNNATLAGHVEVHDFAIIGGLSAIHQFGKIGSHAFVGGMTGIAQDLPPFMLAVATEGTRGDVQSPNLVGLRRLGATRELVSAFKDAYKLIWSSSIPRQEALIQLEAKYDFPEIKIFVEFIRNSQRGILGKK